MTGMGSHPMEELIRGLQERAARAQPATVAVDAHGWWLRHAPGCAWWVSTVLPHRDARAAELARRVEEVEAFYSAKGSPARFQITPGVAAAGLDQLLVDRGYRVRSPVSLQVAAAASVASVASPASHVRVEMAARPSRAWFDVWSAVSDADNEPRAEWALLNRVRERTGYAMAIVDGQLVAVGRVVVDTGWAGVFGMATLPAARGRGAAGQVLAALARWAGVNRIYLQVEQDNLAARQLYQRAGFTEIASYHYRSSSTVDDG
jgi:RimJ/RimL family protein N-acetyltransferase